MNCVYVHDDKNVAFVCVHHLSPLQASMKNVTLRARIKLGLHSVRRRGDRGQL